jgi:hypothetical protein
MAKGQKHGNREVKKPKATAKKPIAGAVAEPFQFPGKPAAAKKGGK